MLYVLEGEKRELVNHPNIISLYFLLLTEKSSHQLVPVGSNLLAHGGGGEEWFPLN